MDPHPAPSTIITYRGLFIIRQTDRILIAIVLKDKIVRLQSIDGVSGDDLLDAIRFIDEYIDGEEPLGEPHA